jgi:hypothetical protein
MNLTAFFLIPCGRWDARWAVVKNLLQPDKRDFLPFSHQSSGVQQDFRQYAGRLLIYLK